MIVAGLKLSFLGIGAVAVFLLILIMFINLSFRFLSLQSAKELAKIEAVAQERQKKVALAQGSNVFIAIITAAIVAHRARAVPPTPPPPILCGKCQADRGP